MTMAATRVTLGWAIAFILGGVATIFGAGFFMGPLKALPSDVRELRDKSEANTLKTEVALGKLDVTISALSKNVSDLSDSIRDARILRNEFNAFREETRAELTRIKSTR